MNIWIYEFFVKLLKERKNLLKEYIINLTIKLDNILII